MTMDIEPPQASTSTLPSASAATKDGSLHKTSRRLVRPVARGMLSRTTCIHPQLRDLLVVANGQVIGASYQHLARYTLPKRREPLQQLTFIPNVLVQGCGVLACGGQHAELFLRSADHHSHWGINTQVGKSINNSAHIYPSPSQPLSTPRVLVCNNDCGIYRYDLHFPKRWGSTEVTNEWNEGEGTSSTPEMKFVDRISLNTPVNHTSVSPDGRSMVAVGDTNEVFVFAISPTGWVTLTDTIEAADDASFSTSWSRSGDGFAIASQDGSVTVFDRRYLEPVKRFHSYQRGPAGAARVVKYSQGSNELLAFTEQKNYIHVVDARTYEYTEAIYIPDVELEEVGRTGLSTALAPLQPQDATATRLLSGLRNDISSSLTGAANASTSTGSRGASYSFLRGLRDNPWDTMPTDDAYETLLSMQDCPLPSAISVRDDSLLSSLPSPTRRPWMSGGARRSPVAQVSNQPTTVSAVLNSMHEFSSPTTVALNSMTGNSGGSAITGLDWDETGSRLYACTERIILEWQVDSASRRSHPAATIL